jgi:hypothetical protein
MEMLSVETATGLRSRAERARLHAANALDIEVAKRLLELAKELEVRAAAFEYSSGSHHPRSTSGAVSQVLPPF